MENLKNLHTTEIFKRIRDKKLRIGVAVEGGGLREVVSAAMLSCPKDLGLAEQIQCLSGTSSGAIWVQHLNIRSQPILDQPEWYSLSLAKLAYFEAESLR